MFVSKKNLANLYMKIFAFFPLNNSPDVAWYISERYSLGHFERNLFFFNGIIYLAKIRQRKRDFFFIFFYFGTSFLCAKIPSLESMLTYLDSCLE